MIQWSQWMSHWSEQVSHCYLTGAWASRYDHIRMPESLGPMTLGLILPLNHSEPYPNIAFPTLYTIFAWFPFYQENEDNRFLWNSQYVSTILHGTTFLKTINLSRRSSLEFYAESSRFLSSCIWCTQFPFPQLYQLSAPCAPPPPPLPHKALTKLFLASSLCTVTDW